MKTDARALAEACRSGVYRLAHRRSEQQRRVTARLVRTIARYVRPDKG